MKANHTSVSEAALWCCACSLHSSATRHPLQNRQLRVTFQTTLRQKHPESPNSGTVAPRERSTFLVRFSDAHTHALHCMNPSKQVLQGPSFHPWQWTSSTLPLSFCWAQGDMFLEFTGDLQGSAPNPITLTLEATVLVAPSVSWDSHMSFQITCLNMSIGSPSTSTWNSIATKKAWAQVGSLGNMFHQPWLCVCVFSACVYMYVYIYICVCVCLSVCVFFVFFFFVCVCVCVSVCVSAHLLVPLGKKMCVCVCVGVGVMECLGFRLLLVPVFTSILSRSSCACGGMCCWGSSSMSHEAIPCHICDWDPE